MKRRSYKNPYNIRGFKSAERKGPELFNFGPFLTEKAAGIEAKSRLRQHFLSMGDATETIRDVRKGRKLVGFRAPSASAWISPVRKNSGRRRNPGLDEDAIHELVLFIENDGELYRMQTTSIIENLAKKKAKGQYDAEKAAKLWGYLVENGARKYAFEFGTKKPGTRRWTEQGLDGNGMFPKPERIAVARELERKYRDEVDYRAAELASKKKKNPTNRWGESFKKGDLVSWGGGAGGRATGRYVKLAPANDFSRAYGRQALISLGSGPMSKDPDDWMKVGLGDLKNEREARKNGSRYTARATSGRFWAGQSERFPWRRNPTLTRMELILLSQAAKRDRDYKTMALCDAAIEGNSAAMRQCGELFETKYLHRIEYK